MIDTALRGHRDDSSYHPEAGELSSVPGVGNFVQILNYGIKRGDKVLENHYKNHKKNASYPSKTSQNDLIFATSKVIVSDIISQVKKSKYFSILADECMDKSGKEQLSIPLRYVSHCTIYEEFLGFVHLKDVLSGKYLSDAILLKINSLGLDISNCRGQGYDGAGAMSGYKNGCSAHILNLNRKALYTHCFSHRLNLSVSQCSKIIAIDNMMSDVQRLSDFFRLSEQRQISFEKHISNHCPSLKRNKLKDPGRTRWLEWIFSLGAVVDLYPAIWETLEDMRLNTDKQYNALTQKDALNIFKAIDSFDFLITLIVTYNIFNYTLLVTELLQSKNNDIADGIHMIDSLISLLSEIRENCDIYHNKWFQQAVDIAEKFDISVSHPRITKKQTQRANHPSNSTQEYYKYSLTIPLVDHVFSDISSRFSKESIVAYSGLYLIPSKIVSLNHDSVNFSLKEKLSEIFKFYEEDLLSPHLFENELELWQHHWIEGNGDCPSNIVNTLKAIDFDVFPNIKECLKILGTLPITSCECERTFSGLRRVKTHCRTSMSDDRLSDLCIINFHYDKTPNSSSVIDMFAAMKNRRLEFIL